jgi:DNA primase
MWIGLEEEKNVMLDIWGWIDRQFPEYREYGNPVTDLQVDCPFCGDDSKQHLHISIDKQAAHCFRCGYSSNWVNLIMDVTGLPYHRAIGELYVPPKIRGDLKETAARMLSPKSYGDDDYLRQFSLPDDFAVLDDPYIAKYSPFLDSAAKRYMLGRGFSSWYWMRYRIGIAPSQGYRVIIPIERDYWQGRAIHDWDRPKYKNPKAEARHVIFNSPALELYDQVVICEGAFSAMAVGENAVALIGKEPTQEKTKRLLDAPVNEYIIALEPNAFKTMRVLLDALYRNGKKLEVWNYKKGDPADGGDYTMMDYGLKSQVALSMRASKFSRSK